MNKHNSFKAAVARLHDDNLLRFIGWAGIVSVIFLIGYYLRAYFAIYFPLALSPYDAFYQANLYADALHRHLDQFSAKALAYPVGYAISAWLRSDLPGIYATYIAGSALFYLIGKEIGGSRVGGLLAFAVFAVGSENLIQYTGIAFPAGLCYVFIMSAIFCLLRYRAVRHNGWLSGFIVSAALAIFSYHTGADAMVAILLGLIAAGLIAPQPIDKRFLSSFLALIAAYAVMVLCNDMPQVNLIKDAFYALDWRAALAYAAFTGLLLAAAYRFRRAAWLQSEYWPLGCLLLSVGLAFWPGDIFSPLLRLGAARYYSSAITLNNYLAQALVLHAYTLPFLAKIWNDKDEHRSGVIKGWAIGLGIIAAGLAMESYFARILDYTFPLAFVSFGWFWSQRRPLRKTIAIGTILLLIASQLMIFRDPFSMRRYYGQEEIASARNVIAQRFDGIIFSDLRTTALYNYLGLKTTIFIPDDNDLYSDIFYNFQTSGKSLLLTRRPRQIRFPGYSPAYYLVLAKSMKTIMYSTNFETTPLTDSAFRFYGDNFPKVYDDGITQVYKIRDKVYE